MEECTHNIQINLTNNYIVYLGSFCGINCMWKQDRGNFHGIYNLGRGIKDTWKGGFKVGLRFKKCKFSFRRHYFILKKSVRVTFNSEITHCIFIINIIFLFFVLFQRHLQMG